MNYFLGARTERLVLKQTGQNKFEAARPRHFANFRSVFVDISLPGKASLRIEFEIIQ
jgi:hypothetical protein